MMSVTCIEERSSCFESLLLAGGELADLAGGGDALPGGIGGRAGAPLGFGLECSRLRPVHTHRFGHGTGALRSALFFLILLILRDLPCSNTHKHNNNQLCGTREMNTHTHTHTNQSRSSSSILSAESQLWVESECSLSPAPAHLVR